MAPGCGPVGRFDGLRERRHEVGRRGEAVERGELVVDERGTQASRAPGSAASPGIRRAAIASTRLRLVAREEGGDGAVQRLPRRRRRGRSRRVGVGRDLGGRRRLAARGERAADTDRSGGGARALQQAAPRQTSAPRSACRVGRHVVSLHRFSGCTGRRRCPGRRASLTPEVRHDVSRVDPLRMPDPLDEVLRRVRQAAGDVAASREAVQARADVCVRAGDPRRSCGRSRSRMR